MTDAFRDAELVADAVAAGLDEGGPELGAALDHYAALRDAASMSVSDHNTELARLDLPLSAVPEAFAQLVSAEAEADAMVEPAAAG